MSFMNTTAQTSTTSITEFKIKEHDTNEVIVLVRTNDGKSVQFVLESLDGNGKFETQLIHSKITPITKVKRGNYVYKCIVKGEVIKTGRFVMP